MFGLFKKTKKQTDAQYHEDEQILLTAKNTLKSTLVFVTDDTEITDTIKDIVKSMEYITPTAAPKGIDIDKSINSLAKDVKSTLSNIKKDYSKEKTLYQLTTIKSKLVDRDQWVK